MSASLTGGAVGSGGLIDQIIGQDDTHGIKGLEADVNNAVNSTGVASASDALKLQLKFIQYSTQITAASQMIKVIGEAMNATVRNIG